jgi:hypothetical protein
MRYFLTEADANRDLDGPLPPHVLKYAAVREPSIVMPWICAACGGQWTEQGSYAVGRCTRCGTPRPANQ